MAIRRRASGATRPPPEPSPADADTTTTRAERGSAAERLAQVATNATGSSTAFAVAVALIATWAITGPLFGFSDTWQLVINTGTTIVTFLMVFLIQRAQNKDAIAVQLKLNEIVAALDGSSNRLINVEDLSEQDLAMLHGYYRRLAELTRRRGGVTASHTIEEAEGPALPKRRRMRR
jgi:low affinity Fe/Cu permease